MKVAITTKGKSLEAPFEQRFGRAAGFLIVDTDSGQTEFLPNEQNLHAAQGAGIQSAQNIIKSGAHALISGHCGPKAFRVLAAAGISIYTGEAATVGEILIQYRKNTLTPIDSATVEGHWA